MCDGLYTVSESANDNVYATYSSHMNAARGTNRLVDDDDDDVDVTTVNLNDFQLYATISLLLDHVGQK